MGVQDLWQSLRGHQPRVELPVSMRCDPPRTDDITFQAEFSAGRALQPTEVRRAWTAMHQEITIGADTQV